MTWTKTGEEFPLECAQLSDAAYRTHHEGLTYAMMKENDGKFHEREIKRFAESSEAASAVQELIDVGFWKRGDGGQVQILHHMDEQPSAAYIRDKRRNDAMRQRRHRELEALLAQGLSEEQAEAELEARGIPLAKPATSKKVAGSKSRRDETRDKTRDETRDSERNGTERNGTELQPLRSNQQKLDDEWLNYAPSPIGREEGQHHDLNECTTVGCDGRLTEFAVKQGKAHCLECERTTEVTGTYG